MKILFIPYGTEKAPATRYRVSQYIPLLKEKGFECRVFSAISDFSTGLTINSPDFTPTIRFFYYVYIFAERLGRLLYASFISQGFDIVFLQRTTFPFKLEKLLKKANKNIIFDIDDAIYLPDKDGDDVTTRIKKYVKKSEVVSILKVSKTVIVENEYIKDFVLGYSKNVYKIPGPIDTERFRPKEKTEKSNVVIGWIGSPATTAYLYMLDNVFKEISGKYRDIKFTFVGLGKYKNPGIGFEKIPWAYEREVSDLQRFDIGVMPMLDNKWTRGKLGCKMLQYMALGIPAVVSYTPTNAEIIKEGENGFFAKSDKEWLKVLSSLIENKELRIRIGKNGRATILEKCSLSQNVSRLIDIFKSI